MRILITGANGQLGCDLRKLAEIRHDVFAFSHAELDVTNFDATISLVQKLNPDVIIHTAAYTQVDAAESNIDDAFRVNAMGTRNVVVAAEKIGCKVCYVSSDYVFDGRGNRPYLEYDQIGPVSIYGKSKRAGEELVQSLTTRFFIVRTSWVFGPHGNNFVKTMLRLGSEQPQLRVVNDQIGSPTYTLDLSSFLLELVTTERYGIYHASNQGACSWYELAKAIFEEAKMPTLVEPCTTDEFPRPAPRPQYSVMDNLAIRVNGFKPLRPWREAIHAFIMEYLNLKGGKGVENYPDKVQ